MEEGRRRRSERKLVACCGVVEVEFGDDVGSDLLVRAPEPRPKAAREGRKDEEDGGADEDDDGADVDDEV